MSALPPKADMFSVDSMSAMCHKQTLGKTSQPLMERAEPGCRQAPVPPQSATDHAPGRAYAPAGDNLEHRPWRSSLRLLIDGHMCSFGGAANAMLV